MKDSSLQNATAIGYNSLVSASNSLILGSGVNVGIGNTAPQNKLEITSATTNTSGLRFTNLTSTSTPSAANNFGLSVDANGDVILVPAATANTGVYGSNYVQPANPASNTGGNNTYVGISAGESNTTGINNAFFGLYAGQFNATGNQNAFFGQGAGNYNYGSNNSFLGAGAGFQNYNGHDNAYFGTLAGYLNSGNENAFFGSGAGLYHYSGHANTFIGYSAGGGIGVTNSERNTYLGYNSGLNNNGGTDNTFVGLGSGRGITSSNFNVCVGKDAGFSGNSNGAGTQLTNVTLVGGLAKAVGNLTNASAIGYDATVSANNSLVLGNAVNVGIGNTAPQNKLEITSATTNTSGLRFTNLKSTSTPSTANSLGLSVDSNGDVILVPAGGAGSVTPDSMLVKYIGTTKFVGLGIASPIEKLHVSGGNLRVDNVLPRYYMKNTSTGTDCTLAELGNDNIIKLANKVIHVESGGGLPSLYVRNNGGNIGVGNTNPNNKLEITSTTTNTSGLRFTNLKSTSTPSTANSLALSVDANGDVILVPAATGGLTNPVTNLQVLSGTAGVSGLRLNNLPLSTTAAAANGKTLSVDATGNVILVTAPAGFTNPVTNLQVQSGTAGVSGLTLNNVNSASATTAANGKVLSVDATGNVILVPATATVLPAGADVWDQLTNGADYLIRNKNNKSVMIGTVAAAKTSIDYKLYVEKGVLSEKFKVSAQANWPDYVFGKNYSLMPLKEVETFIATNNHLPEIPSAKSIEKDGLDLGKMDAMLLKKIEELTLYLIEQSKQLSTQQLTISKLQEKLELLEQNKK